MSALAFFLRRARLRIELAWWWVVEGLAADRADESDALSIDYLLEVQERQREIREALA